MEPAIKEGERVLVFGWAYIFSPPQRDEIIVVSDPREKNRKILKRVERAAKDSIWVRGDNISQSTDSRNFGPIKRCDVLGKVILKY